MKSNSAKLLDFNKQLKAFWGIRSQRPKPHFLGIGTQKGGTTTLYQILKQHPDIFLPDNKEIHYFTKFYNYGDEWYINHFKEASAGKIRGEITPYYIYHEAVPKRIYKFKKNIKLILLLRNPVERALSQYFHSVRLGLENLTLEEALKAEKDRLENSQTLIHIPGQTNKSHQEHSYISRSRYEIQIQRYTNLFKAKNLLILKSEDIFKNNISSLNLLSTFLGIKPFSENINIPIGNPGAGESTNVSLDIKHKIINELSSTYKWVKEEIGITWDD